MKRTSLAIALIAAAVPLSPLAAQDVASPEKTAVSEDLERMFKEIDRNGDGKVSKIEMTSYGYSKGMGVSVRQKRWKSMDADRNGSISYEEFVKDAVRYKERLAKR